jgi:hypothetical protein
MKPIMKPTKPIMPGRMTICAEHYVFVIKLWIPTRTYHRNRTSCVVNTNYQSMLSHSTSQCPATNTTLRVAQLHVHHRTTLRCCTTQQTPCLHLGAARTALGTRAPVRPRRKRARALTCCRGRARLLLDQHNTSTRCACLLQTRWDGETCSSLFACTTVGVTR